MAVNGGHRTSAVLVVFAFAFDLLHINDAAFFKHSHYHLPLTCQHGTDVPLQRCSLSTIQHASGDTDGEYDQLDDALIRLGLTPQQSAAVRTRAQNNANQGKGKRIGYDPIGTLTWLEKKLWGPDCQDREGLAALVVGHPPVLGYDVDKDLGPTVDFYVSALTGVSNGNNTGSRVAAFLSRTPGLLEYSVAKRLAPRLARFQTARGAAAGQVDEVCLRAIATKTDSKFEEWLLKGGAGGDHMLESGRSSEHRTDVEGEYMRTPPRSRNGPSCFVVVSNLQSGGNIGNIVRSASIFGCKQIVVVGQKRYRLTGDHGSRFDVDRCHLYTHQDAKDLLHSKGVRIYGIEITDDAEPIMRYDPDTGTMKFPFDRRWEGAAFVFGNEGQGLSEKQREICDAFVFVPQTRGGGGSASLNVACAASVVLQAYCMWAGYPDAERKGEKFVAVPGEGKNFRFQHSAQNEM